MTIPSVLSFEKKLVPSDGYLYGTNWNNRNQEKSVPLQITTKSVRGTVSHRLKKTTDKDILKLNMDIADANPQRVDSCSLSENQDTIHLHFTLKVLGNIEKPSASGGKDVDLFNSSYPKAVKNYIEKTGFKELAHRYATNIANARFLWRNRVGAEKIEVIVKINDEQTLTFDAKSFSLADFNKKNPDLEILTDKISQSLKGELPYLLIKVDTYALIGEAQEVYPSEEMVLDKSNRKDKKSKILYHVNEEIKDGLKIIFAAMHSQKIGNAIRTIDTWYPKFNDVENGVGPIAVEVYGSVTNRGSAFRTPKDKVDFYTLFDRFALGEELANENEEHYVMSILVRGGVFGQSGKESKE
jgi:CRISPR-associated protein Csy3